MFLKKKMQFTTLIDFGYEFIWLTYSSAVANNVIYPPGCTFYWVSYRIIRDQVLKPQRICFKSEKSKIANNEKLLIISNSGRFIKWLSWPNFKHVQSHKAKSFFSFTFSGQKTYFSLFSWLKSVGSVIKFNREKFLYYLRLLVNLELESGWRLLWFLGMEFVGRRFVMYRREMKNENFLGGQISEFFDE